MITNQWLVTALDVGVWLCECVCVCLLFHSNRDSPNQAVFGQFEPALSLTEQL